MLIVFKQGQGVNDKGEYVDHTVAINPEAVATVERNRSPGWSVITMRDRREHSVEGSVEEVTARINEAVESKNG